MINNFVEFMTDKILPDMINDYLNNGGGSPSDFVGSDDSTMDYTKAGWTLKCYMDMLDKGEVTQEVEDVTRDIMNFDCDTGGKNYECVSPSGYNLLQIMANEAKGKSDFEITQIESIFDVGQLIGKYATHARTVGQQTFVHMLSEFREDSLISSIDKGAIPVGKQVDNEIQNKLISPYYLSLKNTATAMTAGADVEDDRKTLDALKEHADGVDYLDFMGENNKYTGPEQYPTNELSKFLLAASHDAIRTAIGSLREYVAPVTDISTESPEVREVYTALTSAVTQSDGLTPSKAAFDIGLYASRTQGLIMNRGYSPLMYYIGKYKGSSDINVLNYLSRLYNPLALSVDDSGTTEGFTPLSILADSLSVNDDLSGWNNPELASFIKTSVGKLSSDDPYLVYVASGVVYLATNGRSHNSFGVINNIMLEINSAHESWWSEQDESTNPSDFEQIYTTLVAGILPGIFGYSFYSTWMYDFDKNVG